MGFLPPRVTKQVAAMLSCAVSVTVALGVAQAESLELQAAGSTFSAPLYTKWIDAFERANPSISMHYASVGSGEGLDRFKRATVDIAASDVALTSTEAAKIARGVIQVPATAGMVVLAYNLPGLNNKLKLPQDVYADIFMGRIRTWDDPRIKAANPGLSLPARDIALIVRQESSGTTFAFTSHLAAIDKNWSDKGPGVGTLVEWPHGAMIARGNEGVASRIRISEGAIGYVEFGFAQRLGLPTALLQNKEGQFIAATPESGIAALAASAGHGLDGLPISLVNPGGIDAYPIVTYSWLLLYESYPVERAKAITTFVNWGLNDGQSFASELGYLALPAAVVKFGKTALSHIK